MNAQPSRPTPQPAPDSDWRRVTIAGYAVCLAPGVDLSPPPPLPRPFRLKILHLNDLHGHLAHLTPDGHEPLFARRRGPLPYRYTPEDDTTRYRLAPWCYEWAGGFYHDFLATHQVLPDLSALLRRFPAGFTPTQAADAAALAQWRLLGYVSPVIGAVA